MKGSEGLNYVTGPMGSGKSYFGARKMAEAFMAGKYVITNVQLREGWEYRIARHTPQAVLGGPWGIRKRAELYRSLYVYETEMERATAYRVPGKKGGRALMVWDEVHNDMNNREWMRDENKFVIKWATQLRKLGFVAYFLSQHRDNTDAALRRIANAEVRLRNQRENVRVFGIRWCPIPFFLAIWVPANTPKLSRADMILGIERYFLGWERNLYETMDVFHGLDGDLEEVNKRVILLPPPGSWDTKRVDNTLPELIEGKESSLIVVQRPGVDLSRDSSKIGLVQPPPDATAEMEG